MLDRFGLAGKGALVTGAGGGIGRATATFFARAGACVLAVDIDASTVDDTVRSITAEGGRAAAMTADVSAPAEATRVVAAAAGQDGGLSVLANVAGVLGTGDLVDTDPAEFDRVLNVNLRAGFLCCREAIRVMRPRRSGSIVNVASSITSRAVPGYAAYAASKGGVVALTKALAVEAAPWGIRANAVSPGLTLTPMTLGGRNQADQDAFVAAASAAIPLGRCGDPDDIACAILFLASDAASFITGQTLSVNGGSVMPG